MISKLRAILVTLFASITAILLLIYFYGSIPGRTISRSPLSYSIDTTSSSQRRISSSYDSPSFNHSRNLNDPTLIKGYPLSRDVVIHSVHYDDRSRDGHQSIILFLVDVKLNIFDKNWITKCGSEKQTTDNFKLHKDYEDKLMHGFFGPKPYPYEDLVLECYDIDFDIGDHGFLWYTIDGATDEDSLFVTSSEEPIVIPAPRVNPTEGYSISIMTCTKIHNHGAPYIAEFLRYQETVGIDHVYVTVLDNFIKDGGLQKLLNEDLYVRNAIKRNYITFGIWREWYEDKDIYTHATSLEQMDCYYRHRGTYDYVFVLDTDDFFNPFTPGVINVKDYVMKWCRGSNVGSCAFRWITYYPEACGLTSKEKPIDGNITKLLKSHANTLMGNRKSIHLTNALVDCSFHDAKCNGCLIKGYKVIEVPQNSAYVAHLRVHQKPPQGC